MQGSNNRFFSWNYFFINTLKEVFNLHNRIYDCKSIPDPKILDIPLNIDQNLLRQLKRQSIDFLIKNLVK